MAVSRSFIHHIHDLMDGRQALNVYICFGSENLTPTDIHTLKSEGQEHFVAAPTTEELA